MTTLLRAVTLFLLLTPALSLAENSTVAGDYTIHHNALPVTSLSPDMASIYGLTRSKYRGLLNVSVIPNNTEKPGKAVTAKIRAYAINLIGQQKEIKLREIIEGDAIYYLGQYPITHLERLTFHLEVEPKGSERAYKATLTEQFFIE